MNKQINSFQSGVHQLLDIYESIMKVPELIVNIANIIAIEIFHLFMIRL